MVINGDTGSLDFSSFADPRMPTTIHPDSGLLLRNLG